MSMANSKSDKSILRLPAGLRDEIKGTAAVNGRSMNDEMISRLMAPLALRDHFAAHAPEAPEWFRFPGYPEDKDYTVDDSGTPQYVEGAAEAYRAAVVEWKVSREAAWRYTYADAMLKAREGGTP